MKKTVSIKKRPPRVEQVVQLLGEILRQNANHLGPGVDKLEKV